jgi:hypothetical protein
MGLLLGDTQSSPRRAKRPALPVFGVRRPLCGAAEILRVDKRRRGLLAAEVHKLQVGLIEVLQQCHGGLQVVTGLGCDAQFVALDLGLD